VALTNFPELVMDITGPQRMSTDSLDDASLIQLEADLRRQFYEAEQRATPAAGTRRPSLTESPDLLKAFNRWSRVSAAAKKRGLEGEER
jgi:hypothetical protein